ncbi:Thioredoxin domain-containing protein [Entamoeba marina]
MLQIILHFLLLFIVCNGKVIELSSSNFSEKINENEYFFVKYTILEGCPYCDEYTKEFTQLSHFMNIPFGAVVCENDEVELCENQNITALPTSILYKNGKQFRQKNEGDIEEAMNKSFAVIVVHFPNQETANEYNDVFEYLSNDLKRFRQQFLWCVNNTVNDVTVHTSVVGRDREPEEFIFTINSTKTKEIEFKLIMSLIPSFMPYNPNDPSLQQVDVPVLHYIYSTKMTKASVLEKIAKKYKLVLPFVSERNSDSKSLSGHSENVFPCISIVYQNRIYPMDESIEITEESITTFVENFLHGKINSVKHQRKTHPSFFEKNPPIITGDIYNNYTKGDAVILVCPLSNEQCVEFIQVSFTVVCDKLKDLKDLKLGVVDIEQDEVVDDDVIPSYPALLIYNKNKPNIPNTYPIHTFDPIETINLIKKTIDISIDLNEQEQESMRDETGKRYDSIKAQKTEL